MIIILFGVTGAGKTTIGEELAARLGWVFYDADQFHPPANIEKMSRSIPLTDEDRRPWLANLRAQIETSLASGENAVLACSALKQAYREMLQVGDEVKLVFLKGDYALIEARLNARRGHFMPPGLLQSQFDALELPRGESDVIEVDVAPTPPEIAGEIRRRLNI